MEQFRAGTHVETGDIGIGTTSPGTKLDVYGGTVRLSSSNSAYYTDFINAVDSANAFRIQQGGYDILHSRSSGGNAGLTLGLPGSTSFVIERNNNRSYFPSGNVGIGTTTPEERLHISGTGTATTLGQLNTNLRLQTNTATGNAGNEISFRGDSTGAENVATYAAISAPVTANGAAGAFGYLSFSTKAAAIDTSLTERLRITNSGNVGIGTTSPWRTLSVTGTVGFDGLTGSTGAGSLCLDANKQVVYNDASDSCLSSTRATKHDIQPLTLNALGMIEGLEPVSFVYNEGNDRTRFGFIAEDTAAVDPHLTTYNADGDLTGIDDRAILSILVAAIKELAAKITDFAESFTTKELIATNGTFESVATKQLCAIKSDGTQVCFTGDQLGALLSQTAGAAASISVPSSPSKIREPEPPISVSSSTPDTVPDLTNSEQSASANSTSSAAEAVPANDNDPAQAANDNAPQASTTVASSTAQ